MRKDPLNYFVVFLTIIFSSRSSSFVNSDITTAFFAIILLSIAYIAKTGLGKNYFIVLSALIFFLIIEFITYSNANISSYLRLAIRLIIVAVSLRYIHNYWLYFERIMFKLIVISLILFTTQIFFRHVLINITTPINNIINYKQSTINPIGNSISSIIFTIHHTTFRHNYTLRNSGFMWEPGAFAAMILIAMIILYIKKGFNKPLFRRYLIYSIALLTTLSTTGYIAFVLFLLMLSIDVFKVRILRGIIFFIIFISVSIYVSNLPFVTQKIIDQSNSINIANDTKVGSSVQKKSLGRFGSLVAGIKILKNNPITGIGLDDSRRTGEIGKYQWTNGLIDYALKFGLIGIILLIINLYKSINQIGEIKITKINSTIIVLILMTILFSNPIAILPIFLALQFSFLFMRKRLKRKYLELNTIAIKSTISQSKC